MSDLLRPLLDSNELESDEPELYALLNAARGERPPTNALPTLAAVLGATSVVATVALTGADVAAHSAAAVAAGSGGGSAFLTASLVAVGKYFAVGVGLGVLAISSVPYLLSATEPESAVAAVVRPREARLRADAPVALPMRTLGDADQASEPRAPERVERSVSAARPAVVSSLRDARAAAEPREVVPPTVLAEPAVPAPAVPLAVAAAPASDWARAAPTTPASSLAAEVAVLDRARAALARGDAGAALSAVAEYQGMPRSKILDREATLLRIRALDAAGQRALASQLAEDFVRAHPESRDMAALKVLTAKRP